MNRDDEYIENYFKGINGKTTIYVGDPCYSLHDEKWRTLLNSKENTKNTLVSSLANNDVLAMSTEFGDGFFPSNRGNFPVDSGTLGCVNISACSKEEKIALKGVGLVLEFDEEAVPCYVEYTNGIINVWANGIKTSINTTGREKEEREWEEEEWNEDEER